MIRELIKPAYQVQIEQMLHKDERRRFIEFLHTSYPIWKNEQSKLPYAELTSEGSGILYQQQRQEQPRAREGFGDILKRYTFGYFIKEPYKGWPVIGGLLGLAAGAAFGPLGALFSGLYVGSLFLAGGLLGYWGWTRGERKPENPKWLDGRSIGKYVADNWERWFPRRQPQTQLALQCT